MEQSKAVHRSISTNGQRGAADQPRDGRSRTSASWTRRNRSSAFGIPALWEILLATVETNDFRNRATQESGTQRPENWLIGMLDHEKSVRRLPSDRILKFLDGRFHWERMDQGVTRSTAGKHLKPMVLGTGRLWNPEPFKIKFFFMPAFRWKLIIKQLTKILHPFSSCEPGNPKITYK